MKALIGLLAIIMTVVAAVFTVLSFTDNGKIWYKDFFCKDLTYAINTLFQTPNKYRAAEREVKEGWCGGNRYFSLQKQNSANNKAFEVMRDFILDNFYTRNLGYEVKVIVQYQAQSLTSDVNNVNFTFRPILFIKETNENKGLVFNNDTCDAMIKDAMLITTQESLTQNLDSFLTVRLRMIAFCLIIGSSFLSAFALGFFNN